MRAKSFALLILALGCGLVASIGITQVLSKKDAGPAALSADEASVFIVREDIDFAEPLTAQVLKIEPWPKDKIPAGALTKIEDIEGRRTRTKLYAGEPILENKLFPKGKDGGGVSIRIPPGYRAVPVGVDVVSGGAGMILPGDRVDVTVYVKRNPVQGILQTGIQDVLQDIKVFAVGSVVDIESDGTDGQRITAKTISLLVTPTQAKMLMLASELGSLRLVMRGDDPDPDNITDARMLTFADLFRQGADVGDRNAEQQITPGESTPKSTGGSFLGMLRERAMALTSSVTAQPNRGNTVRHTMRVVHGEIIEDVTLEIQENLLASRTGFQRWRVTDAQPSGYTPPAAEPVEAMTPDVPVEPDAEPEDESPEDEPSVEGN